MKSPPALGPCPPSLLFLALVLTAGSGMAALCFASLLGYAILGGS